MSTDTVRPFEDLVLDEAATREELAEAWRRREEEKEKVLDRLLRGEYQLVDEEDDY